MTAFNKVMIMPAPATHRIFIKIQNANLLRVVKQLATDSTIYTTFEHRDKSGSIGECEVPIVGSGQKKIFSHNRKMTVISTDSKKCLNVKVLSDKCQDCLEMKKSE